MNADIREVDNGIEILWADTSNYVGKLVYLNPGESVGLRYLNKGSLSIYCMGGVLRVWKSAVQSNFVDLQPSETFHVQPKQMFRFESPKEQEHPTIYILVGTNFPDDIITIEKKQRSPHN